METNDNSYGVVAANIKVALVINSLDKLNQTWENRHFSDVSIEEVNDMIIQTLNEMKDILESLAIK